MVVYGTERQAQIRLKFRRASSQNYTIGLENLKRSAGVVRASSFEEKNDIGDLEECIECARRVLEPSQNPTLASRDDCLELFGLVLRKRWESTFDKQDLNDAIHSHRKALALRPPGHTDPHDSLHNLTTLILARFQRVGTIQDLHEAILIHREPPNNRDRCFSLATL